MVNPSTSKNIDLETVLKSAGQSFSEAQKSLVSGLNLPVNMVLNSADLELRVAISYDAAGKIALSPISSEDIGRGGIDPALISTVRFSFVSSIGDLKAEPAAAGDIFAEAGDKIPSVVGMKPEKAAALLKSSGWKYAAQAASAKESTTRQGTGQVVRQQPEAGQQADKAQTVIRFWIDLGNTRVVEIDGIGEKFGDKLTKTGISTVGELSMSDVDRIASTLRISKTRAQSIVDQAGLMSRLAVLGFRDEAVELIVNGAQIKTMDQLASWDAKELLIACQKAITDGKVKVPRAFKLTLAEVKSWIKSASDYLND